jgi:hypothetical protein
VTDARATQVAAEIWVQPNASAQATQLAMEAWTSVALGPSTALATIMALEQWANVPSVGPPVVNRNTAVTVNTG